jgi:predicted nuclease of restriction endonuclease-like (RecB) superfamily
LTWTHYRALIRVPNANARNYYLQEAATQQWTVRTLERHIHSFYHERLLHSPHKKSLELEMIATPMQPRDILKDQLVLEFLDLPAHLDYKEKDIEKAIIRHLQHFMLEPGRGKIFVLQENQQLFATRYRLYLPTEEELQQLIETDRSILEEALTDYPTWP